MRASAFFIPLTLLSTSSFAYDLVRQYSGDTFFDRWTFLGGSDVNLTNGDVNYLGHTAAVSAKLVYTNSANNVIIKVDNTTNVPQNEKRNSIRLDSTDTYGLGSLWFGLRSGPDMSPYLHRLLLISYRFRTGETWPEHGEIDIIEGVNLATQNQMALHTLDGCVQEPASNQLGTSGQNPDCHQQNGTTGCTVIDTTNKPSLGSAFNAAGGGVWATQFDDSGVFIWFFDRASVPDNLKKDNTAKTLDVSSWGAPVASYPSTKCNMKQFFGPQKLVLDITLCGDWAGNFNVYPETCANQPANIANPLTPPTGVSACYFNNVVGPGSHYDDAFFEISYVRAYATGDALASQTATTGGSGASSTIKGTTTSTDASQTGNAGTSVNIGFRTFTMTGLISVAGLLLGALMV
ncbi:glycoside hydrolase family 16 protein [Sphaerobolus stellatus SS14]|uniref:Glycoside hydrolase family 16 protein n=1 Tax=Sphaerobolus stellatus (strain SS14) TaxID=990650 RepID=A0A0C9V6E0_SPHS4|nr:glycoside hydrolase family 16 protein [Sphaerobolus stellatus SS14]